MQQDSKLESTKPTSEVPVLVCPRDEAIVAERMARREALIEAQLVTSVQAIFARVKEQGDRAVLMATTMHDGVELAASRVPESEVEQAVSELPPELRAAIELARGRIERVNRELLPRDTIREIEPGVRVGELYRPLDSVALWIPCRKGPLLSTALMLVTAASVARVPRVVVLMPPCADGSADPGTLAAARLAGAGDCFVGNGVALLGARSAHSNDRDARTLRGPAVSRCRRGSPKRASPQRFATDLRFHPPIKNPMSIGLSALAHPA